MKIKKKISDCLDKLYSMLRRKYRFDIKMYAHMFIEDIYLKVLPYDTHDKPSFVVKLQSSTRKDEIELCEAIEGYSGRDLKEGVTDFIRETVKCLVYQGRVFYRILYTGDPKRRFDFIRVYSEDVFSIFGCHFVFRKPHRRPRTQDSHWGKIIQFKLPAEFQYIPNLIKKISRINPVGLPDFAMNQYDPELSASELIPVDFKIIREAEEIKLAKLTRELGWTGRRLSSEKMTEFYSLHRELMFNRFLIKLRSTIITDLNRLLGQLSKDMNFPSSVTVDGLPTEDEITASMKLLVDGSAPFSEVRKPFWRHYA